MQRGERKCYPRTAEVNNKQPLDMPKQPLDDQMGAVMKDMDHEKDNKASARGIMPIREQEEHSEEESRPTAVGGPKIHARAHGEGISSEDETGAKTRPTAVGGPRIHARAQ